MISRRRLVTFLLPLLFLAVGRAEEAQLHQDGSVESSSKESERSTPTSHNASFTEETNEVEANAAVTEKHATTSEPANIESAINETLNQPEASSDASSPDRQQKQQSLPPQSGPLIDLLGPQLLSMEMIDERHAQLQPHLTNEILHGKEVIGLYFSADWCGPCRKFTPELLTFYDKINARKGKQNQFQIVWISRCRDMDAYGQYFAKMPGWLALPPQEAMGERGKWLGDKYKVKGIPSLVLVDDLGQVITIDARNKVPADRAGVGFPWRSPLANFYLTLVPRSVRFMIKSQIASVKDKAVAKLKSLIQRKGVAKLA
jgi:nucleoredoxin